MQVLGCGQCRVRTLSPFRRYRQCGRTCLRQRRISESLAEKAMTNNMPNSYKTTDYPRACNCIGPQNGQPLCPCAMRGVRIIDGRYIKIQDLGPAPDSKKESSHD